MKRKPSEVIADCKLLKTNSFVTERGIYTIRLWGDGKCVYLEKRLNKRLCEFVNLTKMGDVANNPQ